MMFPDRLLIEPGSFCSEVHFQEHLEEQAERFRLLAEHFFIFPLITSIRAEHFWFLLPCPPAWPSIAVPYCGLPFGKQRLCASLEGFSLCAFFAVWAYSGEISIAAPSINFDAFHVAGDMV